MNHIDDGTIHAWLDGALDATQSREIDVHVAQCSVCAAAVAEARGFVAGASRILLALDDVPAGVTPKRAPVARRQWRAAPWVTGIAAAFVLAIGITTWNRGQGAPEMARSMDSAVPIVAKTIQTPASAPSAPAAAAEAELRTKAEVPQSAAAERDRKQMSTANVAPQRVESALRRDAAAGALAGGVVAGAPSAATPGAARARVSLDEGRGARPAESPKPVTGEAMDVRVLGARQALSDSTRARLAGPAGLAGCYSMRQDDSEKKGLASQLSARAAAVAKRAAAAPAPTSTRAEYITPTPPAIVRLDTARKRAGYAVLAATSDSLIGFWSEIGSDSASVDLLVRGEFIVARMNRVECPER
jgi:hypothetical protein